MHRDRTPSRLRRLLLAAALAGGVVSAACHDEGDIKVTSLTFAGNKAFGSTQLKSLLATRQSGWLPWSAKQYFDRAEFDADLERLKAFYADRGYPHARVTKVGIELNAAKTEVRLNIAIDEGAPVLVERVEYAGFEGLPGSQQIRLSALPIRADQPRDQDLIRSSRTAASNLLRDHGFARARVDVVERPGSSPDRVVLAMTADAGPKMTFGEVDVVGLERVGTNVVMRELTFKPGQLYSRRLVVESQRRLNALQLFELANLNDRGQAVGTPPAVPIKIAVAEGPPRRLQLGVGYSSEERGRVTFKWTHRNWLGGARVANVDAKYSFTDRGVTFGVTQPHVGRPRLSLDVSGTVWQVRQLTYSSNTAGGRAGFVYRVDHPDPEERREPVRYEYRAAYVNEFLRYGIQATALTDLSKREERIALGLDPDTGRASGARASIDLEVQRTALDNAIDPHKGSIVSAHLDHVARALGGSYQFDEIVGEVRGYWPVTKSTVFAAKARYGTLAATDAASVPFAARYFLGGSSSLRGWGRFQVSPLNEDGFPVGGRSQLELSAELRVPVRENIGVVGFVDAGNVWANDFELHRADLRWDVGGGVRYRTVIGFIRADIGYQLNPIDGLIVNGQPLTRRWRIHFSIGQAF